MEKHVSFPALILSAYLIRVLAYGASVGDAFVIIGLCSLYGFYFYTEAKKEPEANKELKERLLYLEEQHKLHKEAISALRLGNTLRK